MSDRQISVAGRSTSVVASSKLFSIVLTFLPRDSQRESICPSDELLIISRSLDSYCTTKENHVQWRKLLQEDDPLHTESPTWNSYIGPILGFKLYTVLSGSAAVEGKIPRSAMSHELSQSLIRVAKCITEKDGWPSIFADAFIARWNTKTNPAPLVPAQMQQSLQQNVSQKVAASVVQNLGRLKHTFRSKYMANIIGNIELAASYLGIMTLGLIDVPVDTDFPVKLQECLQNAGSHSDDQFSDILKVLNLSLVEFQAPLFCSLAISPILLFRTCQLQSSRFGRQYYLSFMMSLGDIKPASLREIETVIWKNLYLVARCQLSAKEMMDRVLDSIVEPSVLDTFHFDKMRFRAYLKEKFDPIRDHTGFFFPASGALIKQEGRVSTSAFTQSGIYSLPSANGQFPGSFPPTRFPTTSPGSSFAPVEPQLMDYFRTHSATRPFALPLGSGINDMMFRGQPSEEPDGDGLIRARAMGGLIQARSEHVVAGTKAPMLLDGIDPRALDVMLSSLHSSPSPRHDFANGSFDDCPSEFSISSPRPQVQELTRSSGLPSDTPDKHDAVARTPTSHPNTPSPSIPRVSPSPRSSPNTVAHPTAHPNTPSPSTPRRSPSPRSPPNTVARIPTVNLNTPSPSPPRRSPPTTSMARIQNPQKPASDGRFVTRLSPYKRAKSPVHGDTVPSKRVKLSEEMSKIKKKTMESVDVESEDYDDSDVDMDLNDASDVPLPEPVEPSEPRRLRTRKNQAVKEHVIMNSVEHLGQRRTRTSTLQAIKENSMSNDLDEDDPAEPTEGDDDMLIPRLEVSGDKERITSPTIHVYSADQTKYFAYRGKHYSPEIAQELQTLATYVDDVRMANGLPVGQPIEWLDGMTSPVTVLNPTTLPNDSPIYTLEYSTFLKTSAKDLQDIFRSHPAIVVHGRPTRLKCNLESLEEWGGVDELRDMHDNSRYDPNNTHAVFVRASFHEFLQTSKNLNSLDNPLSGGTPAPIQLATDLRAAIAVYDDFPTHLPVRVMNWGLLAKADAFHPPHIDRPGTCTWVAIEDGLKKWDLAFPSEKASEEASKDEIANPAAYGVEMAAGRNYSRGWDWYSVLLHPGTMLLMQPGVVHSVTTLKDSIALGGHFFSAPTINRSVYSIFHTFVGSHTITNVPMDNEQQMLLRILLFWHRRMCAESSDYLQTLGHDLIAHLPNLLLFEDFVNFAMLLNFAELVLVVTPSRYSLPSPVSFQQVVYQLPRQQSREMCRWIQAHFLLLLDPPVDDGHQDDTRLEALMLKSILRQAHTLWHSVKCRSTLGVIGASASKGGEEKAITASQVLCAIGQDLADLPGFSMWQDELLNQAPSTYSWPAAPGSSRYVLKRKGM